MCEEYYDEDGFRLAFESDTDTAEKQYFMRAFPNVNQIAKRKIHCTSCQTHIGTAPVSEAFIRMHPVLRVTHCRSCHAFYNSGEFDKGEDGSELYCRWCGQGGEVYCCSKCPYVFCKSCILKNLSRACVMDIVRNENWHCFSCAPKIMWHLRAQHWALINFIEKQKKEIKTHHHLSLTSINVLMKQDLTTCCPVRGTQRLRGNQVAAKIGGRRSSKRTVEEEDDNVALINMKHANSGDIASGSGISSTKQKNMRAMVVIPPLTPSLLELSSASEKHSSPAPASPLKQTELKELKKEEYDKPTGKQEEKAQAEEPPAKKKRPGGNEVVCTPDIMSMFNPNVDANSVTSARLPPGVYAIGTKGNSPRTTNPTEGPVATVTASQKAAPQFVAPILAAPQIAAPQMVAPVTTSTSKPKAILHKSMPRNLSVRMNCPSHITNQVNPTPDPGSPVARVTTGGMTRVFNSSPVYHTINGYRIDLHTAAQQGTYRLPDGKLIQVRKQFADGATATTASNASLHDTSFIFGPPEATAALLQHQLPVPPLGQLPTVLQSGIPHATMTACQQGSPIRPAQPPLAVPVLTPLYPQTTQMFSYAQQQQLQQQAQHHQQLLQQQHQQFQQQLQLQPLQQNQIQQQLQQKPQQKKKTARPIISKHTQQQAQVLRQQEQAQAQHSQQQQQAARPQQQTQRLQSYTRMPHQLQQHSNYAIQSTPQLPVPGVSAPNHPNVANMQQTTGQPGQLQILQILRGLVTGPHEESTLGNGRKDFEAKLLTIVEICSNVILKIQTLSNSNSFKNIRNVRDLKDLLLHLSYLLTYGIGRFKTLQERCEEDVKKMGFTKQSDFVMVNNRNPEDGDNSEDDDDVEIIEQNMPVIEVDSDDEEGEAVPSNNQMPGNTAGVNNSSPKSVSSSATHVSNSMARAAPGNEAEPKESAKASERVSVSFGPIRVSWNVLQDSDNGTPQANLQAPQETDNTADAIEPISSKDIKDVTTAEEKTNEEDEESSREIDATFGNNINPDGEVEFMEADDTEVSEASNTMEMSVDLEPQTNDVQPGRPVNEENSTDPSVIAAAADSDNTCPDTAKDRVELIEIAVKEAAEQLNIKEANDHGLSDDRIEQTADVQIPEYSTQKAVTIEESESTNEKQNQIDNSSLETCLAQATAEVANYDTSTASDSAVNNGLETETEKIQTANAFVECAKPDKLNETSDIKTKGGEANVATDTKQTDSDAKSEKTRSEIISTNEKGQPSDRYLNRERELRASNVEISNARTGTIEKDAENHKLLLITRVEKTIEIANMNEAEKVCEPGSNQQDVPDSPSISIADELKESSKGESTDKIPQQKEESHENELSMKDSTIEFDKTIHSNEGENSTTQDDDDRACSKPMDVSEEHESKDNSTFIQLTEIHNVTLESGDTLNEGENSSKEASSENFCSDPMDVSIENKSEAHNIILESIDTLNQIVNSNEGENPSKFISDDFVCPDSVDVSEKNEMKKHNLIPKSGDTLNETEALKKGQNSAKKDSNDKVGAEPMDVSKENEMEDRNVISESGDALNETVGSNEGHNSSSLATNDNDCSDSVDGFKENELKKHNLILESGDTLNETINLNEGENSPKEDSDDKVAPHTMGIREEKALKDKNSTIESVIDLDEITHANHEEAQSSNSLLSNIDEKMQLLIKGNATAKGASDSKDEGKLNEIDEVNEVCSKVELNFAKNEPANADEVEQIPKGECSDKEVINLMDLFDDTVDPGDELSSASSSKDEYCDANESNFVAINAPFADIASNSGAKERIGEQTSLTVDADHVMLASEEPQNQERAVEQPPETAPASATSSLELQREP